MAIDLQSYEVLKEKGMTSVQKVGEKAITALVAMPTFHPGTGEQIGVASDQFNLQGLDDEITKVKAARVEANANFDAHIAALEALRADVAAALK